MSEPRQLPAFASEKEEADWWYSNRESLDNEFAQAIREGRARRSTLAERVAAAQQGIQLDAEDEARARELATKQGVEYRAFVKALVHRALERESEPAAA